MRRSEQVNRLFPCDLLVFSSIFNSGDIPHKSDALPLACDEYERLSPGLELLTVGAKRLRSFN